MNKILVTVNFDGVVSPVNPSITDADTWEQHNHNGQTIMIKKAVSEFLEWLSQNEHIDVIWASTRNTTPDSIFNTPDSIFNKFPALDFSLAGKKYQKISENTTNYKRVLVIDDDFSVGVDIREFVNDHHRYIMIRPFENEGLSEGNIKNIKNLITNFGVSLK